jgi:hypothetical protein
MQIVQFGLACPFRSFNELRTVHIGAFVCSVVLDSSQLHIILRAAKANGFKLFPFPLL